MKRLYLLICLFAVICGCNNDKKDAEALLNEARQYYEANEWEIAKQKLDSLKSRYPKQVEYLKDGLVLMRSIELKEQERNFAYCDSLLSVKEEEAKELSKNFILEKDPQYQDIGTWVHKRQKLERNVERSYLRSSVNENGKYALISVYFGKGPIRHNSLKVSAKDGSFAETAAIPYDGGNNFSFNDNGNTSEVVTYNTEKDGGVSAFIYQHPKEKIKVEYKGGKNYIIYLADNDRKALRETFEYAAVLSDIDHLKKELEKSQSRIAYLKLKLEK
ncbi:MAG: hypothetical protein PUB21_04010 [Bacteroidales bacterium]|nr:hypothetical protein [Bacteroidales bacterium]